MYHRDPNSGVCMDVPSSLCAAPGAKYQMWTPPVFKLCFLSQNGDLVYFSGCRNVHIVVRVDAAPGFMALRDDNALREFRIVLEIGRVKKP